jgi:hypothetical protein
MERFKRDAARPEPAAGFSGHLRLRAERAASSSGEHSIRYGLMREVLLTYLSPILVDSVLTRALEARSLSATSLNDALLAELASDIMVGLRLFVPEARLPALMLALADLLESPP